MHCLDEWIDDNMDEIYKKFEKSDIKKSFKNDKKL